MKKEIEMQLTTILKYLKNMLVPSMLESTLRV